MTTTTDIITSVVDTLDALDRVRAVANDPTNSACGYEMRVTGRRVIIDTDDQSCWASLDDILIAEIARPIAVVGPADSWLCGKGVVWTIV